MVNVNEGIMQHVRREMEYTRKHEAELPPRTISVHVTKGDDWLSTASRPGADIVWYSDQPKAKGGQEKGPTPLTTFLSALGFCQFIHYNEHSIIEQAPINSLGMKVEGKTLEQRPRRFTEVTYEVQVASSQTDETIKRIARAAAQDCYVTNTLRAACKVRGVIIHNGNKIDEHLD